MRGELNVKDLDPKLTVISIGVYADIRLKSFFIYWWVFQGYLEGSKV